MGEAKRNEEERIAVIDKLELFLMEYEDLCNSPEITTKEKWDASIIITMTFEEAMADNVKHLSK